MPQLRINDLFKPESENHSVMSDSFRLHELYSPWNSPDQNTDLFLLQCMKVKSESEVAQSCPTLSDPWTVAYQAPLPMGFSRQEYWSGVPLPSAI